MREHLDGHCPNCNSQIVLYDWGFECSTCKYDHKQWSTFLTSAPAPLWIDSPALFASDMTTEQMREALEEASIRG